MADSVAEDSDSDCVMISGPARPTAPKLEVTRDEQHLLDPPSISAPAPTTAAKRKRSRDAAAEQKRAEKAARKEKTRAANRNISAAASDRARSIRERWRIPDTPSQRPEPLTWNDGPLSFDTQCAFQLPFKLVCQDLPPVIDPVEVFYLAACKHPETGAKMSLGSYYASRICFLSRPRLYVLRHPASTNMPPQMLSPHGLEEYVQKCNHRFEVASNTAVEAIRRATYDAHTNFAVDQRTNQPLNDASFANFSDGLMTRSDVRNPHRDRDTGQLRDVAESYQERQLEDLRHRHRQLQTWLDANPIDEAGKRLAFTHHQANFIDLFNNSMFSHQATDFRMFRDVPLYEHRPSTGATGWNKDPKTGMLYMFEGWPWMTKKLAEELLQDEALVARVRKHTRDIMFRSVCDGNLLVYERFMHLLLASSLEPNWKCGQVTVLVGPPLQLKSTTLGWLMQIFGEQITLHVEEVSKMVQQFGNPLVFKRFANLEEMNWKGVPHSKVKSFITQPIQVREEKYGAQYQTFEPCNMFASKNGYWPIIDVRDRRFWNLSMMLWKEVLLTEVHADMADERFNRLYLMLVTGFLAANGFAISNIFPKDDPAWNYLAPYSELSEPAANSQAAPVLTGLRTAWQLRVEGLDPKKHPQLTDVLLNPRGIDLKTCFTVQAFTLGDLLGLMAGSKNRIVAYLVQLAAGFLKLDVTARSYSERRVLVDASRQDSVERFHITRRNIDNLSHENLHYFREGHSDKNDQEIFYKLFPWGATDKEHTENPLVREHWPDHCRDKRAGWPISIPALKQNFNNALASLTEDESNEPRYAPYKFLSDIETDLRSLWSAHSRDAQGAWEIGRLDTHVWELTQPGNVRRVRSSFVHPDQRVNYPASTMTSTETVVWLPSMDRFLRAVGELFVADRHGILAFPDALMK